VSVIPAKGLRHCRRVEKYSVLHEIAQPEDQRNESGAIGDESILHEFEKAGFSTRLWAAKRRLVKERMNLWPLME